MCWLSQSCASEAFLLSTAGASSTCVMIEPPPLQQDRQVPRSRWFEERYGDSTMQTNYRRAIPKCPARAPLKPGPRLVMATVRDDEDDSIDCTYNGEEI